MSFYESRLKVSTIERRAARYHVEIEGSVTRRRAYVISHDILKLQKEIDDRLRRAPAALAKDLHAINASLASTLSKAQALTRAR
tara:strand:+ start:1986 stop:2237 length:252 start_codon:yes stop_codon:yes gene_type:complete